MIEHGGWNGSFYSGWTNDYHWKPTITQSELDVYKDPAVYSAAGSKYTTGNHDLPNMLGTGPYLFTMWDKTTNTWRIDYNDPYWKDPTFAQAGDKAGNYIYTIIEQGNDYWPTRKMRFLAGEFDFVTVPGENMYDLLVDEYTPIPGINLVYNIDVEMARWFARDWVQGWYYNALLPGLYAYDLYKATPGAVQNIDLNIQSRLIPILNYSTIYIFHNQMRVGGGLGNGTSSIAPMVWFASVKRTDNNGGLIYATLGLTRTPGEFPDAKEFANGTYVLVAPLGSANATFSWYEDGTFQKITGSKTGVTYTVGAESYPITSLANDTDPTNNKVTNGTFIAKTLLGDIDGNGVVDIYDAIRLSNAFGSSQRGAKFNADADFNGDLTIDIYDAIILAGNFNKNVLTA